MSIPISGIEGGSQPINSISNSAASVQKRSKPTLEGTTSQSTDPINSPGSLLSRIQDLRPALKETEKDGSGIDQASPLNNWSEFNQYMRGIG